MFTGVIHKLENALGVIPIATHIFWKASIYCHLIPWPTICIVFLMRNLSIIG